MLILIIGKKNVNYNRKHNEKIIYKAQESIAIDQKIYIEQVRRLFQSKYNLKEKLFHL